MRWEKFENIFWDITSKYSKIPKEEYLEKGKFAVVDQGKDFIGGYTNNSSLVNESVNPRIIFGDHTRALKYIDFPFAIGADGVKVLSPKSSNYHAKYLYYFLHGVQIPNAGYSRHFKFLKEIKIPIPETLNDQIKIATILTQAEKLIAQRKQSIALLDEFLKSTFLEMFGDPSSNSRGWLLKTLKDVCSKIQDGTHFSPPIIESGRPYLTAKHVRENKIDFWANPWFISEESHRAIYKRCSPKKGDVIYIKDGATTGYAAINKYDFEFSMLSSLALLKANTKFINSEYLCSWLNNPNAKASILKRMAGGAIKRLTLTKINALQILLPPLPLQTQFAQIVEKTEALKTQYKASLLELQNLFGSLSQKAFKGELDLSKMQITDVEEYAVAANEQHRKDKAILEAVS